MVGLIVMFAEGVQNCLKKGGIDLLIGDLCSCHKTEWHQEVYADEKGRCKWCGKLMRKFSKHK